MDTRLIKKFRKAPAPDEEFRQLFDRYYRPVFHFFSNRGFPSEECLDLTQETFLRVYKSMGQFRREATPKRWLLRIAANIWKNELRRRSAEKRDAKEVSLDSDMDGQEPCPAGDELAAGSRASEPLDAFLAKEQGQRLRRALDELPPQMRRCMLLRTDQELKYREIAAIMKLSVETVKSQIYQARQRLRSELDYRSADENA